jgi:hypothetical protein
VNLPLRQANKQTRALGFLWELAMPEIFSLGFSALFAVYVIAAVIGHLLLIGALLRPFFGTSYPVPMLMWHGRRAQSVR